MAIALDILRQEVTANAACGHHAVVAIVATPLGEMVGDIKCSRSWHGIFIVDEMGAFGLSLGSR